jgi:hypothetical protein
MPRHLKRIRAVVENGKWTYGIDNEGLSRAMEEAL